VSSVQDELFVWSLTRPLWQRAALKLLLLSRPVSPTEVAHLVEICKSGHGLASPFVAEVLSKDDLASESGADQPVQLVSLTHHRGVNALAAEQTVEFGPNLTIVYGMNASGKSGYTRILKRACRSRGREDILGNVLNDEAPLAPQASIKYKVGEDDTPLTWSESENASTSLAAVSVFDSHCASVYIKDKTDVAFRPFGLDIFDKLAALCAEVKAQLEREQKAIEQSAQTMPVFADGTKIRGMIDSLSALSSVDDLRELSVLSERDLVELKTLQNARRDYQTADPAKLSRELSLQAGHLAAFAIHIDKISAAMCDESVAQVSKMLDDRNALMATAEKLRLAAFTGDLLPGTGSKDWLRLWEAAAVFSTGAYPGEQFPNVNSNARCVLCQQLVHESAAERFKHFLDFVSSNVQTDLQKTETEIEAHFAPVLGVTVNDAEATRCMEQLVSDEVPFVPQIREFLQESERLQGEIRAAKAGAGPMPAVGVSASSESLKTHIESIRRRAAELIASKPAMSKENVSTLNELESRSLIGEALTKIIDEIERRKRLGAYRDCIEETSTLVITRKSTELTKELITDQLRDAFKDELNRLSFHHLAVEIKPAGGSRGALYHRIEFSNAPNVAVVTVLSEGESRTLSLAAFLTELATASARSTIIFDDPVSSLDHNWRDRIAQRLVQEARVRQVIVFTHDAVFLHKLMDESKQQSVDCRLQYVRRAAQAGLCSPDLPWPAMTVKDRLGYLNAKWQDADKLFRKGAIDDYETAARQIYGLLRETWETSVSEILLYGVVQPYSPDIQTKRLKLLHDITESECKAVDDGMSECSKWIVGHAQAAADGSPVPEPSEVKKRIEDLVKWVAELRPRRR
jgi:hypothetical protein